MTYAIRVHVENGLVRQAEATGHLPDGTFEITGYDDGNRIHLAVHQHDADGRFVTSAEHTRDRAGAALREAEHAAEAVTEAGGEAVIGVAVAAEVPGMAGE